MAVSEQAVEAWLSGDRTDIPVETRRAITEIFGLVDDTYLSDPQTAAGADAIIVMHERLLMYSEARDLGVQHIATRDTERDPALISKVRAELRAMTKQQEQWGERQ
ncbi:hypothetical protein GTV32_22980 [Gordonia sp. SID5947]|uniref:hypothetical protein n=1 Tax=Gordonia sp. SID5947 TaxID=2690315 RepID=UPI001367C9E8|nr:hypothetical protein [Gordonia sp. SID5947]MYR08998.1 hypothetical protein [Gordonia sp. SID5947]